MSKILVSVFLCLAAASASALDISGIELGSSLEDAKKIMLSLNNNYLKNKNYPLEIYKTKGVPVGYRAGAVCEMDREAYLCDQTLIYQGENSNVSQVIRFQSFPNPKDRFPLSELKLMLQKKYGLDSGGELRTDIKRDPYMGRNNFMFWEYDRAGKQNFDITRNVVPVICDLGFASTLRYDNNFDANIPVGATLNSTCGKYIIAYFREDKNHFVEAFSIGMENIADSYDRIMQSQKAAADAQKREIDAQRAKGLKPNL